MTDSRNGLVTENAWRRLRRYTDARIGLGRAGISLPTSELLAFQLAHARARDAVHFPLDVDRLVESLNSLGEVKALGVPVVLHSRAEDRFTYLQRPDLGRRLSEQGHERLVAAGQAKAPAADLAIVIVDGLSSSAVQNNVVPFLDRFLNDLGRASEGWQLAPLTIVQQGRVAIGDEVGNLLRARMVVVLIGERPGLSSPDSLGIYLTFGPEPGLSDACRNCISNVRPAGLSFDDASQRLLYLIREADRLRLSGVGLKDRTEEVVIEQDRASNTFLTR
ncbi:ethanolamine ammonia-lyase subunit EutC [Marinobacter sp. M216]|uniref:Ethanolamine ammonia-lyase small subunit n=1 Tax=Marinobacter albus TaxID=3030833 RepID=A0ABT7HEB6_9GAMM|nr:MULTISPECIES: ethanolamine ammonia-lyase subunit EutC [unclassified Marinobacter]MBW7472137.1 ethanolamine ammonia-lyase subunit EutC [Marinobacter sp. F4218]MDK9558707.1 ethanolamine ammonia-lyase subunit EutC [Marinobacter sp. M216]